MPKPGDIIDGTFRIERRLGEGASGTAYAVTLARDWSQHARGHYLCLKWHKDGVFKKEPTKTVVARRIREVIACGELNHPNIVKVYDNSEFWKNGRPSYVIMELIKGLTLDDLAKGGAVSPQQVESIVCGAALGLKALHDRRILHRDVKAANIMVDERGRAILMDLGVVRPEVDETLTNSQGFLGTIRFSAPEWLAAEDCTSASDVYSLGTIAFHLLTGHELFWEITNLTRLIESIRGGRVSLPTDNCDLRGKYLANLTRRMLEKRPADRPTLDEVIEILQNERRFQVWAGLHESAIIQRMHESYQKDGESQRALVQVVLNHVSDKELRTFIEQKDYEGLLNVKHVRRMLNQMSVDEQLDDYLCHEPVLRIDCVTNMLAAIDRDQSLSWGAQIEQRCYLVERIFAAEPSEVIKTKLKPLLIQVKTDHDEMMRDIVLDTP